MYNDQPPNENVSGYAHSKGALAFSKSSGFWMVSSVPRFPAAQRDGYHYFVPQTIYGQIILCVTVAASDKPIITCSDEKAPPKIVRRSLEYPAAADTGWQSPLPQGEIEI